MPGFEIPVHDAELLEALGRIERLLTESLTQGALVADQLEDVRGNMREMNVDLDTALQALADLKQQAQDSGVDPAAKAELMSMIDEAQTKIANALNPAVPVDPNAPHVDNTLPGDLAGENEGGEAPPQ